MERVYCDILVVGAGPAGSSAAFAGAREGAGVVVAERRDTIGVPVRCAEYIPRALLGQLPFKERAFVVQPVKSMRTFCSGEMLKASKAPGLIIQRDMFDQSLAEAARKAGAEILTGTRVVGINKGDVLLKASGQKNMLVKPAIIIGADGPHSTVGGWMGLPVPRCIPGLQVRVPLITPMEHTAVYFHPNIRGAYGWVFPRGDEANVGIALTDTGQRSLRPVLEWFVKRLTDQGMIQPTPQERMFGWIPVAPAACPFKGNMLLAGDAAGHAHPITGAGIANAILAGRLAGKWAVEALSKGDLRLLAGYAAELDEELGETLTRGVQRRELMASQWHRLPEILPYCWTGFREYFQNESAYQPRKRL